MKNFIKKCLWFFAFASMILLVNFFINRQFIKKIPVINTTTLIAGDSRVMTAINPKLFSSAINIAQNSESYLITYYKLKYLLPKNEKIKQVIIGFSYPSFSGYMDSLYSNDIATADIFSRIYPIITPKQLFPLKVDVWKYYSVYLKNNLLYPKVNQYPFMGSFTELKYGLNKADLVSVIQRHYFYKSGRPTEISTINTQYLDSIVTLTKQLNKQLVLVNIPLQQNYLKKVPQKFINFYNQEKSALLLRNVKILDYSELVLEDKYFKDYNHLDLEGADYFTQILIQDLGNNSSNKR